MKKSGKELETCLENNTIAARYAPVHVMVTELLARIEPDGYATLLKELRAEWKPSGSEAGIVERMADLSCRMRGCFYLETEILKRDMEALAAPGDTPDMALGRAYIRDLEGPNLLDKLTRYQSRLQTEFSRCVHIMQRRATSRRRAEQMAAATLAKRKPCTSVVQ